MTMVKLKYTATVIIHQKHSSSRDESCVVGTNKAFKPADVPKRGIWIINHTALLL